MPLLDQDRGNGRDEVSIITPDAWTKGWETDVLPIDTFTGDRRWFTPGSLSTRNLPMPLLFQVRTAKGHEGAVTVGSVDRFEIVDNVARASGSWLDPDHVPEVNRALALMAGKVARVSADLEPDMDVRVEDPGDGSRPFIFYDRARVCGITIVPIGAFDLPGLSPLFGSDDTALALTGTTSWRSMPAQPREVEYNADEAFKRILAWADGNDSRARGMFLWYDPEAAEGTRDRFRLPIGDIVNGRPALNFHAVYAAAALISGAHGGLPTVGDEERGRLRRTISEIYSRLSGLFGDPNLTAPWDRRKDLPDVKGSSLNSIAASAAPVAPPDEWFTAPKLPGPVPSPIVTSDGRVVVHLATNDSCHRAIQASTGQCFTPPPSPSGYARFMDGSVVTASGRTIPVGRITVGTSHPGLGLTAAAAKEHYDNTGSCVAIVAAGTDEHGIWLSGALVPEATPEQVAALRRSPISGDWRRHGADGLDLVAALAVNTAGFPAPYLGAVRSLSVDGGECQALIASGAPGVDDGGMGEAGDSVTDITTGAREEPPAPPSVDIDAIVLAAADQAARAVLDRFDREERLEGLLMDDAVARSARIEELQPLAPMADTVAGRREAQRQGKALPPTDPGGVPRYPIRDVGELGDAIRAVGRGGTSHDALRRWIMKRARELNRSDMIPKNWSGDGSLGG